MLQQALAIFLVLGLLIGTLALLRRRGVAQFRSGFRGAGGKTRQIEVIERIALTPQQSLHLVTVRETVLLIGVSPAGCSKLAEFSSCPLSADTQELAR